MKHKFGLLFVLFLMAHQVYAIDFPSALINKPYALQSPVLDSLYDHIWNKSYEASSAELKKINRTAIDKNDNDLSLAIEYYQLRLILDKNKADASFVGSINSYISKAKDLHNQYLETDAKELLANYYWNNNNYPFALENYLYACEQYSNYSYDAFPHKSEYLYELGGKYYFLRDYKTAKAYFLEVWNKVPYEKVKGGVNKLNTLALCYRNTDRYDSAIYYFKQALDYAAKENSEVWIGIISGNLGTIYYKQNRLEEAIELYQRNIELSRKNHIYGDLAISLSDLGNIMLTKKDAKKDMELQQEVMDVVALKNWYLNYNITSNIYPNVARAYAANGQMEKAYLYLDSANVAKDSVAKRRNSMFTSDVEHKIEIEKHFSDLKTKEADIKQQTLFKNALFVVLGLVLLLLFFVYRNLSNQRKLNKIISDEKQKSEMLLLNILPLEVAEELKETGVSKARQFDDVTVLFTDFVDFTTISQKLSPHELVEEIHHCFTAFDDIIERNGLEKIKTIGDAYLAISGLPTPNKNHATNCVNAALEIIAYLDKYEAKHGKFEIRIGINSGSVVAGIVGVRKFAYDIWGDTVNTAARMESSGEIGKVNISVTTYELVKDIYACENRGKIQVKGKGDIDMYFVKAKL